MAAANRKLATAIFYQMSWQGSALHGKSHPNGWLLSFLYNEQMFSVCLCFRFLFRLLLQGKPDLRILLIQVGDQYIPILDVHIQYLLS